MHLCIRRGCIALLLSLALAPTAVRAADSPEAAYLVPSQASELQYVHDTLRRAVRQGDVRTYREMHDPASIRMSYTTADGRTERLTADWLRAHAREWPDVADWDLSDAAGVGRWARLTYRHPHLEGGRTDGRWDFYFLVFRRVGDTWRLTRRAIATFGTVGPPSTPPRVADLALVPLFELPPRPVDPDAFVTGE